MMPNFESADMSHPDSLGAGSHLWLAMLPLLWYITRFRTELAAMAAATIIWTTSAEAKPDKESDSSTMIGWTLVLVVAVSAWLLGHRSSRVPQIAKPSATDPIEPTIAMVTRASQTDPIEPTIAMVEHYRWREVQKMYLTQKGDKFHTSKRCAESRTTQPVREWERCLVCAPGPA